MNTQRLTLLNARAGAAAVAGLGFAALLGASAAVAAPPPGRAVAYVITDRIEAIYHATDKDGKETKAECPNGVNEYGPRERFAALFPQDGPKKWTLEETVLASEAEIWAPTTKPEPVLLPEAGGKISYGLNLDGKVKPTDFTSPDGVTGIDNQFFRAVGCMKAFREGSSQRLFLEEYLENKNFNRFIIALTDVDSMEDDDDVTVTTYRGMDRLVKDTLAHFQADATQRVDLRWGQGFITKSKAKIVKGVLITTEPVDDLIYPGENHSNTATDRMRGARFQLKLHGDRMEGLMAGYLDVETTHLAMNRRFGAHQITYDLTWSPAMYKSMRRLADGYPDPKTGENTAISAAVSLEGVRVHLLFPDDKAPDGKAARPKQIAANTGSR